MHLNRTTILSAAMAFSLGAVSFAETQPMQITIDATDLPRKLLRATVTIPLAEADSSDGKIALWYPKWVPGSHGPGGPIANVAGLSISDQAGNRLDWQRTVGEIHRVLVDVPQGLSALKVEVRYITDQPTTTSQGHDSFGSALIGIVSPSSVLFYAEGADVDTTRIETSLQLPDGWVASTALPAGTTADNEVQFKSVSLRTFVDSPMMCGRHRRIYDLVEDGEEIPPHRLHIFSEAESVLQIHPEMLKRMRAMVTQTARLFGSHPFDQFDILLATTDILPRNGLEHSRSTLNVLGQQSLQNPRKLKGWDRLLVPHEYLHAWCGKFRRPQGMVTNDFHTAKATELLWVYEGLTQYLGELVEARSGWMNEDEFRHRIAVEIRAAMHQQGRQWRPLTDTGACSHTLRAGSKFWPRLRRSQDYYMEGMLFWLEADAIIRNRSHGEKSLDDFCQDFFAAPDTPAHPSGYSRAQIVASLNQVLPYDWDGLIARRVEALVERFDPAVVDRIGYAIQYSNEKPDIPSETFRHVGGVDAIDSIGAVIGSSGTINDMLLGSPIHQAQLGPGMKIIGVNGHAFSENRLRDAIAMSASAGQIELMVVSGDSFETHRVTYDGGPRFMTLVRNSAGEDLLSEIVKPREE